MTKKTSTNEILSATCEEEKPLVAAQIALGELYRRAGEEGFTDEIQRAINQQELVVDDEKHKFAEILREKSRNNPLDNALDEGLAVIEGRMKIEDTKFLKDFGRKKTGRLFPQPWKKKYETR